MLATSISSYVTTASDASFSTINTNMKSAFTKRYNIGYNAGQSENSGNILCLFYYMTGGFSNGYVVPSFNVLNTNFFTNNAGTLTCKKAGKYAIFIDGYFAYYFCYLYNASGSQLEYWYGVNTRYKEVYLYEGYMLKFVECENLDGQLHANFGIYYIG